MKLKNSLIVVGFLILSANSLFAQTCSDGIQNGTETGIDCGGICSPCAIPCSVTLTAQVPPVQGGCCTYVLTMNDAFGDGWNGASMNVIVNGVTFGPYSTGGTQTIQNISICDGQTIQLDYLTAGSWPSECSYTLADGSGTILFADGTNPTVANNVFNTVAQCFNPGVLDCTGGNVTLTASGQGASFPAINNDFDAGSAGTGWNSSVTADFSNPCDPSVDGGTYMWMGNSAPHPRIIETIPLDLSCGGEVCFWLDFATQGNASPCEGIDLANEGVYLEYSTNGGATWVTIEYFGPAGVGNNTSGGGTDPQMTSWNQYCYTIPAGAQTAATMIHWAQTGSSGINNDHWGLDNVTVMSMVNCVPYWYDYAQVVGSPDNPIQTENVTTTTTYTVTYTNGTDACSTTVNVPIVPCACPDATMTGGGIYCAGDVVPDVVIDVVNGAYPITVVYSIDGVNQPAVSFSANQYTISNGPAGSYNIVSVTDNTSCTGTFAGSADVLENPVPVVLDFFNGATYCVGDPVSFIMVQASGVGTLTLNFSIDGVPQPPISGGSFLNLGASAGVYTLDSLSDSQCSTAVSGSQTLLIIYNPVATAGTTTPIVCVGDSVYLTGNTETGTYAWTGPNGFSSTSEDPTLSNAQLAAGGTYTLIITNGTCVSPPSTVSITVNPLPVVTCTADQTICLGDQVTLSGQGATTYSWDNGVSNGIAFTPPLGTQTYTVTGTLNGCTATATTDVTALPIPVANGLSSVNSGYLPLSVSFQNLSTNATSYVWDFGNGNTFPTSNSGSVSTIYNTIGTFTVLLTATNGLCFDTWTDTIVVISYPEMEIHVPNVFSPNGDGSNESYIIDVINGSQFEATIINRWGDVITLIDQLNVGWDGKVNGNLASEGIYFVKYKAVGLDGSIKEGHTFFHLVR